MNENSEKCPSLQSKVMLSISNFSPKIFANIHVDQFFKSINLQIVSALLERKWQMLWKALMVFQHLFFILTIL